MFKKLVRFLMLPFIWAVGLIGVLVYLTTAVFGFAAWCLRDAYAALEEKDDKQ